MANGRPGDSLTHDVVHHRIPTFGPACDDLIRDIHARLPLARMTELHDIVEPWPFTADGRPIGTDALLARLRALRAGLGDPRPLPPPAAPALGPPAAPPPMPPPSPRAPARGPRGRGRAVAIGILVFLLAGAAGAAGFGLLGALLGGGPPSGDAAMGWAITLAFLAMPAGFLLVGGVAGILAARRAWPR